VEANAMMLVKMISSVTDISIKQNVDEIYLDYILRSVKR